MIVTFYFLSDPRTPDIIRYIGKTKQKNINRRLDQHVCDAKRHRKTGTKSNYNYNWINSLLDLDLKPLINELDSIDIEDDSKEWAVYERFWISQAKSWGFKITNLTDGGDGNQNQKFSEESLKKKSDKLKGIPRTEEVKEKISKAHKGKAKSQEHIHNVREGIIKKQGRSVLQYSLTGEFIQEWRCISEAADFYKVDRSSLMRCCQGKFKKSAGFVWKYKNEDIV